MARTTKPKTPTKSVPIIPDSPKAAKAAKVPTVGRNERAAIIASVSPAGWALMSTTPTMYPFQCVCNGRGRKGYELVALSPVSDLAGPEWATDWVTEDPTLARVKVGASCLYHFGIAI
jgi:hypothetical protein